MLKIEELSKNYGDLVAVDKISFSAGKGTVFGLLGPNGAGKSTAINCISGLLQPTSGHASVAGHDTVSDGKAARQNLGVVPQELALYEDLSALENLRYWGKAYGLRGDTLVITGGLRHPADFAKTMALGADAIAVSNAAI